jgi:hypothetical protein
MKLNMSNELQNSLGKSYNIPDSFDEEELMGGTETVFSGSAPDICLPSDQHLAIGFEES